MNIFVTSAIGWVGSAVVDDLITSNHQVIGLVRDDAKVAGRPLLQGHRRLRHGG
ncbi:NAD-dependent epimerase/dehydratase [Pseudomonas sp. M47T1]|uniref:NAD-dependent epimerase/dehydratase n=1 Tax=Pseudomonas sp. M47T1 TaxID=1179778 RepID=UPI000260727C|nr:NAD-dependent epimerase/dehydratase [Pseudomonas sp. M47T1]EIK96133.1 NAD-dependent epimerase/dehydratase [Pseudomonas sp. M47T1]